VTLLARGIDRRPARRRNAPAGPARHRRSHHRHTGTRAETLTTIFNAIPHTIIPAPAAAALCQHTERPARQHRASSPGVLAAQPGIRLTGLGRPAEALPVTEEAVAIRRELAAASPDRYRPDLANSLDNLGIRFWELGRPALALPVSQEAAAMFRELAAASPDRYRPDLANLGRWFSELGRPAEAAAAHREAIKARATGLMTCVRLCRIRAQSPRRH
jgi:tetratricopeptide (TPR) repeat protein